MDETPRVADAPVNPANIRFRAGIRREGAFSVRYVTIHGYRRAYVKAGEGSALILIHGIGDSSDTWRPVVEELAGAPHRDRGGPARPRAFGETAGGLHDRWLRQRHA